MKHALLRPPEARWLNSARLSAHLDLAAHTRVHPPLAEPDRDALLTLAEALAPSGRGGAGFPFARTAQVVLATADRTGAPPVIVVNGAEGEPAGATDKTPLGGAPHLVPDGACLAATAFGVEEIVIGVAAGSPGERAVPAALVERELPCPNRTVCLPERFDSGESWALIRGINGLPVVPAPLKTRAADGGPRGVCRRPTLLANAESRARLAAAARRGPAHRRPAQDEELAQVRTFTTELLRRPDTNRYISGMVSGGWAELRTPGPGPARGAASLTGSLYGPAWRHTEGDGRCRRHCRCHPSSIRGIRNPGGRTAEYVAQPPLVTRQLWAITASAPPRRRAPTAPLQTHAGLHRRPRGYVWSGMLVRKTGQQTSVRH
ncbi:hypothetical protein ACIQB5_33445 [Streptomyces sp. NPDC088560]|uniref:hypothetical protein n=1 Tax=Streptomyces sp. NPDC088560 TaxID=3365868 RepID=UPI003824BB5C